MNSRPLLWGFGQYSVCTTNNHNVGALLAEALEISDITRLDVYGPESQLALLHEPLAALNPQFFALEMGFRRLPAHAHMRRKT